VTMDRSQAPCRVRGRLLTWRQAFAAVALMLSACGAIDSTSAPTTLIFQEPASEKFFPSDEPYRLGAEYFNRGDYGLAERHFRNAVEKAPENGGAWVALASSYDRLRRFDLADRAYQRAIVLCGETPQILNNQGYSQMLRGNLKSARGKFLQAATLDPGNPTILNNIRLLDGSHPYIGPSPWGARVQ
jgi:Flp pilus assembly protein TadD